MDNIHLETSKSPRRLSMPAVALILATLILGIILTFLTYRNIDRERELMMEFLTSKGELVLRSVEAGTRASMMHHMGEGNPLMTLLEENSREEDVAFLQVFGAGGKMRLSSTGREEHSFQKSELLKIKERNEPYVKVLEDEGLLLYLRKFAPVHPKPRRFKRKMHWMHHWQNEKGAPREIYLLVGLKTDEFDEARRKEMFRALMMGGVLFLVGSAGLYCVFLYQGVQVTKSTLSNMKLYTNSVIDAIPAGVLSLDTDGGVVSGNRVASSILGQDENLINSQNIGNLIESLVEDLVELSVTKEEKLYPIARPDGSTLQVKIHGSKIRAHDGRHTGYVLILRDVTHMMELESQLERSRKMASLGKMAAGIAHEIRNPLGTLRGFAQYFGGNASGDKNAGEYADLMVSEVDRLDHAVSSLLQFARPRNPEISKIRVDELFSKTGRLMDQDLHSSGVELQIQECEGVTLNADGDQVLQVLLNVMKNSLNAMQDGGVIELAAINRDDSVELVIKDDGLGMEPEVMEKMFDPFYTTRKSGTGLGLAVSHQIMEEHGGRIAVSSSPGQGCTLRLVFPRLGDV